MAKPDDEDASAEGAGAGKKSGILALPGKILGRVLAPLGGLFAKLKGNKKLLIGAVAAVVLLLGGVGYLLFSGGGSEETEHAAAPEKKQEAGHAAKEGAEGEEGVDANLPQFVDLPEMTVNLISATGKAQFLRVRVTLEIADRKIAQEIQPVMPRILDVFQVYLRELRVADIQGSAGIQRLKEELTKRVNQSIAPAQIDGVLFKDMLVQ